MIQYPKQQHMTLPSVSGAFGTLNITRDPPKSIQTRYKPKVGDTSEITQWIGNSDSRICESIRQYGRGLDPMKKISFSNNGTSGGQYGSDLRGSSDNLWQSGQGQSYYPYRIMKDGAFRAPIIPPQEYLPLSRVNRLARGSYEVPKSILDNNIDNNLQCRNTKEFREIRNDMLSSSVEAGKTMLVNLKPSAPNEDKLIIRKEIANIKVLPLAQPKQYNLNTNITPTKCVSNKTYTDMSVNKIVPNVQKYALDFRGDLNSIRTNSLRPSCTNTKIQAPSQHMTTPNVVLEQSKITPTYAIQTNRNMGNIQINNVHPTYNRLPASLKKGGFSN